MGQGRSTDSDWQDGSDSRTRRWLRRLRWPLGLASVVAVGGITGIAQEWSHFAGLLGGTTVLALGWRSWSARRGQRRWRHDSLLVMPELPSPVSRIPVEREWQWPSHPLVSGPLAIALVGMLYWTLVVNHLQLPIEWLLATVLLALLNLWCWREPLLLALGVVASVALLALIGWAVETFSLVGALAVLLAVLAVVATAVFEIRKRINRKTQTS